MKKTVSRSAMLGALVLLLAALAPTTAGAQERGGRLLRPSAQQIAQRLRKESGRILHPKQARRYTRLLQSHPAWLQFVPLGQPVTIPDGRGGALTALASVLWGGDGSAGNVFFWHNRTFLRAAAPHRLTSIAISIRSPAPGVIVVRYEHYGPKDARCCPSLRPTPVSYRWNGKRLSRTNLGSGFHGGKTLRFPNGLAITLLTFKPATGLTQNPGGPPLRPPHGYQFVATTWEVRNTTNHRVAIASWVARSRGLRSREFVIGNAGQMGLIPARTTVRYYWLFEVARVGRVSIYYGSFRAHWLSRG